MRLHRNGPRDAKALLLATRQTGAGLGQAVFDLVPQAGTLQAGADQLIQIGARTHQAMQAWAEGDVVVDGLRKRVRLLEHHADARAQLHDIALRIMNVLAIEQDLTGHAGTGDRVIHPVQAAQEGRLAAARGPDHRQHLLLAHIQAHALDGVLGTVIHVDVAARKHRINDGNRTDRLADGRAIEARRGIATAAGPQIQTGLGVVLATAAGNLVRAGRKYGGPQTRGCERLIGFIHILAPLNRNGRSRSHPCGDPWGP